jgi:histidine kinase
MLLQFEKKIDLIITGSFSLSRVTNRQQEVYLFKQLYNSGIKNVLPLNFYISLFQTLNGKGVIEPIDFIKNEEMCGMLYKDFDATSLQAYMADHKVIKPLEFAKIAIGLINMISCFHEAGWVLKNLAPDNILINPNTYECRIVDLQRISNVYTRELRDINDIDGLIDCRYISPEQTGRLNLITDFRSDYYVLGILFYEMLTGKFPFLFKGNYEIIHAHLAVSPHPLSYVNPYVPMILNDIVLKLLSKNPEQRYQTLKGLTYDIEQSFYYFDKDQYLKEFKIGCKDQIHHISLSTNLIGRKSELELLNTVQELALQGNKQLLLIHGSAGIGKSRLVREFEINRQLKNETIITAKFDALQKNAPYSALILALKELIRILLKEEEAVLKFWRDRILLFLKTNSGIICDVVPELKIITGEPMVVSKLPPEEAQERFNQTFISFISCFTTDGHALTLFLDDLQWIDIASLKLIELIISDSSVKNFFFIGAYRDNEVDATHPLAIFLRSQEQIIGIKEIALTPLQKEDTKELIMELLHSPVEQLDDFVDKIHSKSNGNIFFIIQLLSALHHEKIIFVNDLGHWEWNKEALNSKAISDNMVELLEHRIINLNELLKKILISSACLGDVCDLKTIAYLINKDLKDVANQLLIAVNQGYLIPLDSHLENFLKADTSITEEQLRLRGNAYFRFSHDRIRHAAISLAGSYELEALNLNAGLYKMENLSEEEISDQVFYIANNYNQGEKLIRNDKQIRQLIDINYKAALKAKNASAYDAAINYFKNGLKYLDFNDSYTQSYNFYLEKSICEFLSGRQKEAEEGLDFLYQRTKTRLEKLEILFPKVYLYTVQDEKEKAIAVARLGYRLFNKKMPESKFAILTSVLWDLILAKFRLNSKRIYQYIERPAMKDEEKIRFMEFTLAIAPSVYQYDQNLFAWNVMRMLFISLRFGNNGISSFGYLGYGMILSQMFSQYRLGEKLANLSILLNNKLEYTALKWKLLLSYYNFVHHWTQPIRPHLEKILDIENGAFANGDPVFAGYAIFIYHQKKFALGFNLESLQQSFEDYLNVTRQRHDVETYHFLESYYYAVRCLRGFEDSVLVMGNEFNVTSRLYESIRSSSFSITADTYISFITTLYLFKEFKPALDHYLQGCKYMEFVQQRYEVTEFNFYGGLICSMAIEKRHYNKGKLLKKLKHHIKKFKVWKNNCEENFEVQYLILSAEKAKSDGKESKVATLYERAIYKAEQFSLIHYKAIACELAARYHLQFGNQIIVKTYLENARKAYLQWGAVGVVNKLDNEFNIIFVGANSFDPQIENSGPIILGNEIKTMLESAQAIKSEEDINSLIMSVMKMVIKYSGADNGYLLLNIRSDLILKAGYNNLDDVHIMHEHLHSEKIPLALIKYVVRLKEPLIIDKPFTIPEYKSMNYFQKKQPLSVLVYPIIRQGEIFGILYLENNLMENIFHEKRIGFLNVIATQLVALLDNAYLKEFFEMRVEERTQKIVSEKKQVDDLLENMLPSETIQELKQTGKTTAQQFENVTILLADIKGFTNISEKLSLEELINKIDHYFRGFDAIIIKYKLEKIKTIGDAYMAIGGFLTDAKTGARRIILAALEMQKFVETEAVMESGNEKIELRIGIHTGPIIAGVVGLKKIQYDIWGDTVNVAARMEQNSEPGKVNVSQNTYELLKNIFKFQYRGKLEAKNKGELDMYFVERP